MLEKASVVKAMRKLLILKELVLRTWSFARPQGVEKERGKPGQKRRNHGLRRVAKFASTSEDPAKLGG
ncbi:hypothetical protein [Verminephrobacter eiseniae]|uniref:hypothetical protein n=1 Tax=Verminephrobacter eiseniae TaxID=364317 RepID=UPI0022445DF0|nr:hypothetical protein [Verminephrobacter eiseniae]